MFIDRYGEASGAALSAIAGEDCVSRLERDIKLQTGKDCVALCSVDAALHTALHLCGVKDGDYVFVPSFTFYSYISAVEHVGGVPVFLDCDPVTRCTSYNALDAALVWSGLQNKLPKAVVVDNAFGSVADYDVLCPLCSAYGIPLVELAADAFGGDYKGAKCGTLGTYGILGFDKGMLGGGSVLVCGDDVDIAEKFTRISYSDGESYDYKMNNVVAALDIALLKSLDKIVKRRKANLVAVTATENAARPIEGDAGKYALVKPSCTLNELKHCGFNVKKPPPVHTMARYGDCYFFEHEIGYSVCESFKDYCFIDMDMPLFKRLQLIKMIR